MWTGGWIMPHDDLPNGHGIVLNDQHIALYRDPQGQFHAMSSICTHLGCDVGWNDKEKVWDCPCHGSRYAPTGEVIHGPARKALPPATIPR